MSGSLIVPSRLAEGKANRRNAGISLRSLDPVGRVTKALGVRVKVWKYDGSDPIPQAPGRRVGKPHGSYIDDLVQLRKTIVLCWRCQSRFYYRRVSYYKDEMYGHVMGDCDACKQFDPRAKFYIPEERLCEPDGRSLPGQCWTPR